VDITCKLEACHYDTDFAKTMKKNITALILLSLATCALTAGRRVQYPRLEVETEPVPFDGVKQ
jgi:hypothetical protein